FTVIVADTQVTNAIVGGSVATQQYGAASIWTPPADGSANRHRCHVNVISPYWGVTTAHCLNVTTVGVSEIRASGLDIVDPYSAQNPDGYKESVGVAAVYPHPNYIPDQGNAAAQNDIALIKFTNPIQQTEPLGIAGSSSPVGTSAKLAGWGWICDSDPTMPNCGITPRFSPILKHLGVKIVNSSECTYPHQALQYFCVKASGSENAMACVGDSGGPVTRKGFDKTILMGIVMGDGDLETGHPNFCSSNVDGGKGSALIVDVAKYKQWIQDTMFSNYSGSVSVPQSNISAIKPSFLD
ncbi:MAG TPA: trypsin-like serine protease, partial [Candidatus Saccharimonadales bacterium]|nr:trypsin-like serine protease [Candidatus Saccharimonadales bacterium]